MLIPSSPAPVELLMFTSEMVTLTICRKYKVTVKIFLTGNLVLMPRGYTNFFSSVNFEGKYIPQKEKLSFAILSVVTFMNANPSNLVQ